MQRFEKWSAEFPELAAEWRTIQAGELPAGWESALPTFTPPTSWPPASRAARWSPRW